MRFRVGFALLAGAVVAPLALFGGPAGADGPPVSYTVKELPSLGQPIDLNNRGDVLFHTDGSSQSNVVLASGEVQTFPDALRSIGDGVALSSTKLWVGTRSSTAPASVEFRGMSEDGTVLYGHFSHSLEGYKPIMMDRAMNITWMVEFGQATPDVVSGDGRYTLGAGVVRNTHIRWTKGASSAEYLVDDSDSQWATDLATRYNLMPLDTAQISLQDVNSDGVAAGSVDLNPEAESTVEPLWRKVPLLWHADGTISSLVLPDGAIGGAVHRISDSGEAVGAVFDEYNEYWLPAYQPAVWVDGVPHRLNDVIQQQLDASLDWAVDINDTGQILASAGESAYLLTPQTTNPSPSATPTTTVSPRPTAKPTVTTSPKPTGTPTEGPKPSPSTSPSPSRPPAVFDLYTTPGTHTVNGRQWRTQCTPYSQTKRCTTEIWATQVSESNGRFSQSNGWVFNNLTYAASPRSLWASNPLAANAVVGGKVTWTAADGRRWRTECDTAVTGSGGCRSYIEASVIVASIDAAGNRQFRWKKDWIFNNMVRFS